MNPFQQLISQAPQIEAKLGYHFKDPSLLALAFIHRSFINENRDIKQHNERLEFLGDSVLGILISDYIYRVLPPSTPEGELSYLRSRLVEASACYNYTHSLQLDEYLQLGKGERRNDGRGRESILADLFEAIVGAIYLDGGIEEVKKFLFSHFKDQFEAILKTPLHNWKALLQDYCQKNFQQTPYYQVLEESGPDHIKSFDISVLIDKKVIGHGSGASKKEAQQAAAADAIAKFGTHFPLPGL